MTALTEAVAAALRGEGLSDKPAEHDSDIHSWRCHYPNTYGPCSCFDKSVAAIAAAVEAVVAAGRAEDWARLAAVPMKAFVAGWFAHARNGAALLPDDAWHAYRLIESAEEAP